MPARAVTGDSAADGMTQVSFTRPGTGRMAPKPAPRSEAQQEYIDSLESRVSELEERLDFTERLLANRGEKETQA